ncbi:MAG: hypothetical protein DRN66_01610 [Candidatus Nanohalarchaeota archaeon]|nr:MAG: hypothetical protein DRN66_01610 [Candidatus Nanohaloarchaeota archaeon]
MENIKVEDIKARHIMSKNYEKINISASIADTLSLFRDNKKVCFVFDKGNYVGIVTERSIVRSRFDPKHHNISSVVIRTPAVDIDDNVYSIAEKMIQTKMRYLPVMTDGKLVGTISDELFFDKLKHTWLAKEQLNSVMTENIISTDQNTPISRVMNMMRENNISRIVVNDEKDEPAGIVALHDVITKVVYPADRIARGEIVDEKTHTLSTPVFEIASYPLVTLKTTDDLEKAVDLFITNKISSIIVLDGKEKPTGIVTITDVFESVLKNKPESKSMKYILSLSKIDPESIDREMINKKISSLMSKFMHYLGVGSVLFIYAKEHSSTNSHVRMRLASKKGVFISTSQNKGFKYDFAKALDRLSEQIEKKKEKHR